MTARNINISNHFTVTTIPQNGIIHVCNLHTNHPALFMHEIKEDS